MFGCPVKVENPEQKIRINILGFSRISDYLCICPYGFLCLLFNLLNVPLFRLIIMK